MAQPDISSGRRRIIVLTVWICGVLLTAGVWVAIRHNEQERIRAEFRRRAEAQARVVREHILIYGEMMYGLRNFFANQSWVTRDEFRHNCRELLSRYHGILALQWVPLIEHADRSATETAATRELARPFVFQARGADGALAPAPAKEFYYPILYNEPIAGNEAAFGYDLTTAPSAAYLARARAERRLVVTPQFRLIQAGAPADKPGLTFTLPVFTPADGEAPESFLGFVQCVFQIHTVFAQIHQGRGDDALISYYYDADTSDSSRRLLYANLAGVEPPVTNATHFDPPPDDPLAYRVTLEIGGRHWVMLSQPNPVWLAGQRSIEPWLIAIGGLLGGTLAALFVNTLLQRTQTVEKQVAERTTELLSARHLLEEDIRQRIAAEQRLRESEARLQAILENSPSAIYVLDLDGRCLLFNRPFETLCQRQWNEIAGRPVEGLFPPEIAANFGGDPPADGAGMSAREFELKIERPDGLRVFLVQKFPLRDANRQTYAYGGIVTDITERTRIEEERRELERRMQASQKLESLGVLAGGIAHDFNNILTAVLANASLARQIDGPRGQLTPYLSQIENAARRAADLCRQMLAYAGRGRIVTDRLDLSEIVRDTAALLEVSISKNTVLTLDLAPELPTVLADATQIRQIVMNLVINAADAIGTRAGRIVVRTSAADFTAAELGDAIGHPELPAGHYAGIEVADNGGGMPPEILTRIFEPFFTTKFSGRGLGLSAALGIVQSHHGALFVSSAPGEGSSFRLFLPATPGASTPVETHAYAKPARLQGTVLVVDDEPPVRETAVAALSALGLSALSVSSGAEAVELCRQRGATIDVMLLDLTMPGLSGEETLRQLRVTGACPKVVLMSGYSESDASRRFAGLGAAGFMPKPFELADLLGQLGPLLAAK